MKMLKHPIQPVFAFSVGITGHRPNRLGKADLPKLSARIHKILAFIKSSLLDHYASNREMGRKVRPILQAFSPLAEGADRLFAEQAVVLGYHLCCPIPFEQKEYEKDFEPPHALEADSLIRFRGLIERCKALEVITIIELDGDRSDAAAAYRAAGRVVLNSSDILVVVWDGESFDKSGGTEETMGEALHQGVPIIWINACSPHKWRLFHGVNEGPFNSLGRHATEAPSDDNPLKGKGLRALVKYQIKYRSNTTSPFQYLDVPDA